MPEIRWTLENIKEGIERFAAEHNRFPTARDFDSYKLLPSARQVQRSFGGLESLRLALGLKELNYTKGKLRSTIATDAGTRGVAAEEALEIILIEHFGEPFVHTQKRYIRGGKSRYDFFVYAEGISFGVDVFVTERKDYIATNVRHKLSKYSQVEKTIPIYFVLAGDGFIEADIARATDSITLLKDCPNIHLILLADFIIYMKSIRPLSLPDGYRSIVDK